jgi:hypothetical protein
MEGKIYWKENGWTSKLWEDMKESGWKAVESDEDPKMLLVQDENGKNIYAAEGRINMLEQMYKILLFR